jgi:hypothetical protein
MVRTIEKESMVPEGRTIPKAADFDQWSELIADAIASGSSAERIRGYLKAISKSTWQLVNWLTHSSNAVRLDASLALDATENTLDAFSTALIRFESGIPEKCPHCGSYRLASVYRPELEIDPPYVTVCESCDWHSTKIDEDDS